MMSTFFDDSVDPSRPYESGSETPPLAFEAEFDGVRRPVSPAKEALHDPSRYWNLGGGGTD